MVKAVLHNDSPWGDAYTESYIDANNRDWDRIASQYTTAGYREGITAGKEAHLQHGFDQAFAAIGAPLGRHMGLMRGSISAVLALLVASRHQSLPIDVERREELLREARIIGFALSRIRLVDIAPPDLEADQHAREHFEAESTAGRLELAANDTLGNESVERRRMDKIAHLDGIPVEGTRPAADHVEALEERLKALLNAFGLNVCLT